MTAQPADLMEYSDGGFFSWNLLMESNQIFNDRFGWGRLNMK